MATRREFIIGSFKYVSFGTGFLILPHPVWAKKLLSAIEDDENRWETEYSLDAFNAMFQKKVKGAPDEKIIAEPLHKVTTDTLRLTGQKFSAGQGKNGSHQKIATEVKRRDFAIKTPVVKYRQKPDDTKNKYNNTGQVFKLSDRKYDEGAVLYGPRLDSKFEPTGIEDVYVCHPAFLQYVKYKEYFCHGRPCSDPATETCKYCNQDFVRQVFFYEGDSEYERKSETFWYNGRCTKAKKNKYGIKVHNRIDADLGEIEVCGCADEIKVTERSKRNRQ